MNKLDMILEINRVNELIALEINRFIVSQMDKKLTPKQHLCLLYLGNNGQTPAGKLARILDISSSSLSQLLRRMEEDNLVQRETNQKNRKEVFIMLSHKGKTYFNQYESAKKTVFKNYFNILTEEETKKLLEINQRILSGIRDKKDKKEK